MSKPTQIEKELARAKADLSDVKRMLSLVYDWSLDAVVGMNKVAPDSSRFQTMFDRWDEIETQLSGSSMENDLTNSVCPVLNTFTSDLFNALGEVPHNKLFPPIELKGTKTTPEVEKARGYMIAAWAVSIALYAALGKLGMHNRANDIQLLQEISDIETADEFFQEMDVIWDDINNNMIDDKNRDVLNAVLLSTSSCVQQLNGSFAVEVAESATKLGARDLWTTIPALLHELVKLGR